MCFALLYANGNFQLSRNFNLQEVGDFNWLIENYEFESIAQSIDELLILNVSNDPSDWKSFLNDVQRVVKRCFMPVAVGGGIRSPEQAKLLFENGADKVVLNTAFFDNPQLVHELAALYGSQSIVASLDFKTNEQGWVEIFVDSGKKNTGINLSDGAMLVENAGAGEIYLNSIERDGTGMGYDLQAIEMVFNACDLPIIAAGGADTSDRLAEGIQSGFVSAVSTAHLFNFMCDGLYDARTELIAGGIPLSNWNFQGLNKCK